MIKNCTKIICIGISLFLTSCAALAVNQGFELVQKNSSTPRIRIHSKEISRTFRLYGIIVPIFPMWMHQDRVRLDLTIEKDSTECPRMIYDDYSIYSSIQKNYEFLGFKDTANWHCSYYIPETEDEIHFLLQWKDKSVPVVMQTVTRWNFQFFLSLSDYDFDQF